MDELLENEFLKTAPAGKRKSLGQFFTPEAVAVPMVRWTTRDYHSSSLLDAGAGTGVFVKCFLGGRKREAVNAPVSIDCIDIDRDVLEFARRGVAPTGSEVIRFIQENFLEFSPNKKYDSIISNPPYYKHHFIWNKSRAAASVKDLTGYDLPITTNIYCLFMFRARALMGELSRCAFIIPGEFLNSDYGVSVKKHLVDDPAFRGIISFSFDTLVFDGALTTSCIVLFETGKAAWDETLFASLEDVSSLAAAFALFEGPASESPHPIEGSRIKVSRFARELLDPRRKWQNYITPNAIELEGLRLVPLGKYASCSRGIATGANDFFTLSESRRRELGIPLEDLLPCVTRSSDVPGLVFTRDDYKALSKAGSKVYLLNPRMPPCESTGDYLDEGVRRGVDLRYLPSHRPTWFLPERQTPAPIWVMVFSRGRTRFVWNKAVINHLTAFHGIYPSRSGQAFFAPLLVYLWSDACQRVMQEHQRQYGNGLKKYEPRDIEKILVPDFEKLDPECLAEAQAILDRTEKSDAASSTALIDLWITGASTRASSRRAP